MPDPSLGIVLVNYNGMGFMPDCIASILEQDYQDLAIVVVDNASTDGSKQWLEAAPDKLDVVWLKDNTGITGGHNAGFDRCRQLGCKAVFLLNNDTVLQPGALTALVNELEPKRILVPRVYFYSEPERLNTQFGDFDYRKGIFRQRFYGQADSPASETPALGTMASACAILFDIGLIDEIGEMDDKLFMYYDDTDFISRAVSAGYQVKYVPGAKLFHRESASSGGNAMGPLPLYYMTRNRLYFMRKHQQSRTAFAMFLAYFWATRAAHVLKWTVKRDRRSLRAFWAGIYDYRDGKFGYTPPSRYRLE